jgi:hypothetical protein
MTGMRGEEQKRQRGDGGRSGLARGTVIAVVVAVVIVVVLAILWFSSSGGGVSGGY